MDRWRANQWRMETTMEEIEGEVEKGSEESKGRGVPNKEQQSKLYRGKEQEYHMWLSQNLNPEKMTAIMAMVEQMVETR